MTDAMLDHNRVLRDAAKSALAPLGLVQKGRSRTWLDDRLWHVIVVEFQPSSWSKGTYLNVGAMWLWDVKDYVSFDYGPIRVQEFERADSGDWPKKCRVVAAAAATHVSELRRQIPDLAGAARLLAADPEPGWPVFHAAAAAGLTGDADGATRLFGRLLAEDAEQPWHRALQARAGELQSVLDDRAAFRAEVIRDIQRSRAAHGLRDAEAREIEASLESSGAVAPSMKPG